MEQLDIFDLMYPPFKINKEIALIEFFGGYGSQALSLKYANIPFKHHKLCEWAVNSIQAYKDVHMENDNTDYSKELSVSEIKDYLFNKGISKNWNEPMTREQIDRLKEKEARTIYNNIQATHNLVNIQQVKGEDLEITDTDKYCYLLTYSFPCQDISGAGNMKGFSDTSTRSGMLWEVERILKECKNKPQVLLMENVPLIHSVDNLPDFNKWILSLEEMGYKNYWQDLIATDYGIPQTRNRTFMVSVLGNYKYTFPKPIPLKLKLKDMLEDNVDEKYYLSEKLLNCFMSNGTGTYPRRERFLQNMNRPNKDIANSITTLEGNRATCTFIPQVLGGIGEKDSNNNTQWKQQNRVYDDNVSISITTTFNPYYKNDLRIRKLTPRECGRLQGVKDEDITKILKHQSNASAYHLFGDSIVVDVLEAMFKEMI